MEVRRQRLPVDQFLRDTPSQRTDALYGGSLEKSCTLAVQLPTAVTQAIGSERVGLRLSPLNGYNNMKDSDPAGPHRFLDRQTQRLQTGPPARDAGRLLRRAKADVMPVAREKYKGVLVGNMRLTLMKTGAAIAAGKA